MGGPGNSKYLSKAATDGLFPGISPPKIRKYVKNKQMKVYEKGGPMGRQDQGAASSYAGAG